MLSAIESLPNSSSVLGRTATKIPAGPREPGRELANHNESSSAEMRGAQSSFVEWMPGTSCAGPKGFSGSQLPIEASAAASCGEIEPSGERPPSDGGATEESPPASSGG